MQITWVWVIATLFIGISFTLVYLRRILRGDDTQIPWGIAILLIGISLILGVYVSQTTPPTTSETPLEPPAVSPTPTPTPPPPPPTVPPTVPPTLTPAMTEAKAHFELGNTYLEQEQWDRAISEYTQAIELGSRDYEGLAKAYFGLGYSSFKAGQIDEALVDFTRAILLDSNTANYYYYRGEAYYQLAASYNNTEQDPEKIEGNNKAIEDYTEAIELGFEDAEIYNRRGNCYAANGNYYGALADYRKALTLAENERTKDQILASIKHLEDQRMIEDLAYIEALIFPTVFHDTRGVAISVAYYNSKGQPINFSGVPVEVTIEFYWHVNLPPVYQKQVTMDRVDGLFREVLRIPFNNVRERPSDVTGGPILILTVNTPNQGIFETIDTSPELIWP